MTSYMYRYAAKLSLHDKVRFHQGVAGQLYVYEAGPGTVAQKIFGVPRHLPEHIAIVRGFMRTYLQIFTCRTVQLVEKLVKNRVFDPWQVLANHS